jgi:hypothetical protein
MVVMEMEVDSTLLHDIWKFQLEDEKIWEIKRDIKEGCHSDSRKMSKDFCGSKEGFVCLMSRN